MSPVLVGELDGGVTRSGLIAVCRYGVNKAPCCQRQIQNLDVRFCFLVPNGIEHTLSRNRINMRLVIGFRARELFAAVSVIVLFNDILQLIFIQAALGTKANAPNTLPKIFRRVLDTPLLST